MDFCQHLSDLLYAFTCKNNIYHPKQCNKNTVVLQTGGNKSTKQFLDWIYQDADLKLDRKYQHYLKFCDMYMK